MRKRFWIESAAAVACGALAVVTLFWRDWIEVTGWDPDDRRRVPRSRRERSPRQLRARRAADYKSPAHALTHERPVGRRSLNTPGELELRSADEPSGGVVRHPRFGRPLWRRGRESSPWDLASPRSEWGNCFQRYWERPRRCVPATTASRVRSSPIHHLNDAKHLNSGMRDPSTLVIY
jgi:hypothetical protein